MAALNLRKCLISSVQNIQRCYATAGKTTPQSKTLKAVCKSIAAKGFLRPNKPYEPPGNAAERVHAIAKTLQLGKNDALSNLAQKFKLLTACFEDLKHGVPNSQVHELATVADVVTFYETPVDTTVPLDAMKRMDLPENLHIQYEYLRFHPDTDTKFNGQTAFPKSSTLVTGLKYRGKYEGHEAKRSWP